MILVRGVSRRVVVVRFADTRVFEQAIFIVRDDGKPGVSAEHVLQEACRVADGYVRRRVRGVRAIPPAVWATFGAAVTGAAWILSLLL